MNRYLFLALYTLVLIFLWPGSLLAWSSGLWPFPPLWVNILLMVASVLLFAAAIYVAERLYRRWKLQDAADNCNWMKKRIGSRPLPGKEADKPSGNKAKPRFLISYIAIGLALCVSETLSLPKFHYRKCVQNGHFLSADTFILQWLAADGGLLEMFCNNNPKLFSTKERQEQAVTYLLEKGYHPNAMAWHGRTALEACLYQQNRHLLPLMLKHGADINYQAHCYNINNHLFYDSPPVVRAAEEDDIELLRYLLAHGATAHTRGDGQTALHIICDLNSQNFQEAVSLLLAAGADINALDAKGRTPLDLLEQSTRHENRYNVSRNCEFLIQLGARHATALPLSLSPAESDITAKLKAANPNANDTELAGVILHDKGAIPYTYSQTSKGNGFITVPGSEGKLDIRCYDAHNDGAIYQHFWAQISLEDKNTDQHRDIVVSYTLQQLDDKDQETSKEHHSQVYIWDPVKKAFLAP